MNEEKKTETNWSQRQNRDAKNYIEMTEGKKAESKWIKETK